MVWSFLAIAVLYWLMVNKHVFVMLQSAAIFRLFATASLIVLALWQIKAQLPGGPQIHFLALTCLTLLLGFRLSMLALPLLMLPLIWPELQPSLNNGLDLLMRWVYGSDIAADSIFQEPARAVSEITDSAPHLHATVYFSVAEQVALHWWLAMIAIAQSYATYLLMQHYFKPHPFVYIFAQGFINSALVISGYMWLQGCVYALKGMPWHQVVEQHWLFIPLVALPEALLNGSALTLLVIYRPQWLATFRESDYFK